MRGMYAVLTPFEKLAYLAFWRARTTDEAARLMDDAGRLKETAIKLERLGLLIRRGDEFIADKGYMAERIEEDNHLYPQRRLSPPDREALLALLCSELFSAWIEEDFEYAIGLEKGGKDVLAGFFWSIMRGPFAVAHAYYLVFGDQPSSEEVGGDFDRFLDTLGQERLRKKRPLEKALRERDSSGAISGKDPKAMERALFHGFAFAFPKGLVDYLRWNVNISPGTFVAQDVMAKMSARAGSRLQKA
jgi:hypothetical protein